MILVLWLNLDLNLDLRLGLILPPLLDRLEASRVPVSEVDSLAHCESIRAAEVWHDESSALLVCRHSLKMAKRLWSTPSLKLFR